MNISILLLFRDAMFIVITASTVNITDKPISRSQDSFARQHEMIMADQSNCIPNVKTLHIYTCKFDRETWGITKSFIPALTGLKKVVISAKLPSFEDFGRLLPEMTNLVQLTVTDQDMREKRIDALFEPLLAHPEKLTQFTHLELINTMLSTAEMPVVAAVLQKFAISRVDLSQNHFSIYDMSPLVPFLANSKNLCEFNLNENYIGLDVACMVLAILTKSTAPIRRIGLAPRSKTVSNYHPRTVQYVARLPYDRIVINLTSATVNDFPSIKRIAPVLKSAPLANRAVARLISFVNAPILLFTEWREIQRDRSSSHTYAHTTLPLDLMVEYQSELTKMVNNEIAFAPTVYLSSNTNLRQNLEKVVIFGGGRSDIPYMFVWETEITDEFKALCAEFSQFVRIKVVSTLANFGAALTDGIANLLRLYPQPSLIWYKMEENLFNARNRSVFIPMDELYSLVRRSIKLETITYQPTNEWDTFYTVTTEVAKTEEINWVYLFSEIAATRAIGTPNPIWARYSRNIDIVEALPVVDQNAISFFISALEMADIIHALSPSVAAIHPSIVTKCTLAGINLKALYDSKLAYTDLQEMLRQEVSPPIPDTRVLPPIRATRPLRQITATTAKKPKKSKMTNAVALPSLFNHVPLRKKIITLTQDECPASELMRADIIGGSSDIDDNLLVQLLEARCHIALCDTTLTGANSLISIPEFLDEIFSSYSQFYSVNSPPYAIQCYRRNSVKMHIPVSFFHAMQKSFKQKYPFDTKLYYNGIVVRLPDLPAFYIYRLDDVISLIVKPGKEKDDLIAYIKECITSISHTLGFDLEFTMVNRWE